MDSILKKDIKLIEEQAGFRPEKSYTRKVLNFVNHIENGHEKKLITTSVQHIASTTTDYSGKRLMNSHTILSLQG